MLYRTLSISRNKNMSFMVNLIKSLNKKYINGNIIVSRSWICNENITINSLTYTLDFIRFSNFIKSFF